MRVSADADLDRWMSRLVSVWRKAQRRPGPPQLSAQEIREVGSAVRTLSLGLTRERGLAGGKYMEDPKLLG
ncbi:MAG TPA: methyltransferase type 12, partial [Myxococcaceae bacterium]|nr:methyltransferase type 12 [Myxococcaceae bacterium]